MKLSHKTFTPVINSNIFASQPQAKFAIINHGIGIDNMYYQEIFDGYLQLRKNVYVDQCGLIEHGDIDVPDRETDADDLRSIHFSIITNLGNGEVSVVSSLRLILKTPDDLAFLPVEGYFPDVFADGPSPLGSFEVSRFISRLDNRREQIGAVYNLLRLATVWSVSHSLRGAFAVVETNLERSLRLTGIALQRVGEAKTIADYNNTLNVAIKIDTYGMVDEMTTQDVTNWTMPETNATFWDSSWTRL